MMINESTDDDLGQCITITVMGGEGNMQLHERINKEQPRKMHKKA
jgi:hypothetical protein